MAIFISVLVLCISGFAAPLFEINSFDSFLPLGLDLGHPSSPPPSTRDNNRGKHVCAGLKLDSLHSSECKEQNYEVALMHIYPQAQEINEGRVFVHSCVKKLHRLMPRVRYGLVYRKSVLPAMKYHLDNAAGRNRHFRNM